MGKFEFDEEASRQLRKTLSIRLDMSDCNFIETFADRNNVSVNTVVKQMIRHCIYDLENNPDN